MKPVTKATKALVTIPSPGAVALAGPAEADVQAYVTTALEALALIMGDGQPADDSVLGALDAAVDRTVGEMARELCTIVGSDRLRFIGQIKVAPGEPPGHLVVTGGASGTAARLLTDALTADAIFSGLFQDAETRARALALGRIALQARDALAATPDQAEVLWEWLCERGERTKTATFCFTFSDRHGGAILDDAVGRPLGAWGLAAASRVAAE